MAVLSTTDAMLETVCLVQDGDKQFFVYMSPDQLLKALVDS